MPGLLQLPDVCRLWRHHVTLSLSQIGTLELDPGLASGQSLTVDNISFY